MKAVILCLIAGYLCGTIQTGYIYGRMKGIDIRNYGSHNAGATNSLRVLGTGAGILVLLGDAFKALIPCLIVKHLYASVPEQQLLMTLITGFGVMLGHDYPFYMGFKGGKGVASTVGILLSLSVEVFLIWVAVFVILVAIFRYVSLGSVTSMIVLMIWLFTGAFSGRLGVGAEFIPAFLVFSFCLPGLSIWRHRTNIVRLFKGEENKLKLFTKGMNVGK